MYCPNCGAENIEKANFCVSCGFQFNEEVKPISIERKEQPIVVNQANSNSDPWSYLLVFGIMMLVLFFFIPIFTL